MYEKPSPHILWSWGFVLSLSAAVLFMIGRWLIYRLSISISTTAILLWIASLLMGYVWLFMRQRKMEYAIINDYIHVISGVIFRTKRVVAIDAVRQITLLQGPLERLCHTAFILISTTGGYLLIEGIDQRQAETWCHRLTLDD